MVKVSAPAKVSIAGEWAVLENGNPLIVASVNKRIFANVEKSKDDFIYISIKDFGINKLKASIKNQKLIFEKELSKEEEQNVLFVRSAIETVTKYLGGVNSFELTTWGEETTTKVDNKVVSIGIGASAASTVAIVSGILKFYGKDIKKKASKGKIYKLAAIAHYLAQGKIGSCFGIASSTFGGIIVYKKFDPLWLVQQIEKGISFNEIVAMEWPELYINSLYIIDGLNLLLGWTGTPSSSPKMVKKMNKWKANNKNKHKNILNKIGRLTEDIIEAWKAENKPKILELLRKNEDLLRGLGEKSGIDIETKKLAILSRIADKHGGAGKVSGAGGGDCGIAVTFNQASSEKIVDEWKKEGIDSINIDLSLEGVREEF